MNKKFTILIAVFGMFFGAYVYAQSTGNGSLSLVKDLQSGLFTLTVSDAEGVASFALEFKTGKLPYSGDFSGCQRSKSINNIGAFGDTDLVEKIKGRVIDCRGGETEFEISAVDAKGKAQVKKLSAEPEPVAPAPTPAPTAPTEPSTKTVEAPAPTTVTYEIIYPVPELGNCKDKEACFAYCELSENGKKCLEFAKKHQLLPEEEIRVAEKVLGVKGGPGGCNSKKSCESYCNDVSRIDECIAFAEENGLMKGRELEEAKKVRAAIQSGQKLPGNCQNKNACENYCKNSEHIDECLAFAESAGFLSPEELEQAKKFMPLMKSGETPGACKNKDECEAYCESDEHMDECIDFAIKHGMIPEEDKKHIEAFKKAGGKGPGGCKGRQCQAFCENPANQKACFEWAKESGILKEEDLRHMEEGKAQLKNALGQMPPEAKECVEAIVGPGGLEGDFFGGPEIGNKIKECFEQAFGGFGGPGGPGGPPGESGFPGGHGGGFSGPGGCSSIDECTAFCQSNPEKCQGFGPSDGGIPGKGDHSGFPSGDPMNSEFAPQATGSEGALYGENYSGQTYPADFEGSCDPGWNLELNPTTNLKYCAITQEKCSELHTLTQDNLGYAVCWLSASSRPPDNEFHQPSPEELQKIQEQYKDQYNQQYQQQYQQQHDQQYQQQYDQQYQQQYQQQQQQYQQPPLPPTSSATSPLGLLLTPFVNLLR